MKSHEVYTQTNWDFWLNKREFYPSTKSFITLKVFFITLQKINVENTFKDGHSCPYGLTLHAAMLKKTSPYNTVLTNHSQMY